MNRALDRLYHAMIGVLPVRAVSKIDGWGFRGLKENHPVKFGVTQRYEGPQVVHVAEPGQAKSAQ
jgi:hypothetical protein